MDVALGAAIRARRQAAGMSQSTLAEKANVSFQQIQKYECGTNRISFSRLLQIARALECRAADLICVFDAPNDHLESQQTVETRIRIPGAVELLSAYKGLAPRAREPLVTLLRELLTNGRGH